MIGSCWILLGLLAFAALPWAEAALFAGEITRLQGTARIEEDASVHPAAVGMPVRAGDRVTTGADSRLVITFGDGTTVTLGASSELLIRDYRDPSEADEGRGALELVRGVLRAITGKLGALRQPDFTVTTTVATIGVRGTDFWAGFLFSDALDVVVFEGKGVYVENAAGRVELTQPGFGTTVESMQQPPSAPKRWPDEKIQRALATVAVQ
jgi:hypothetical protein